MRIGSSSIHHGGSCHFKRDKERRLAAEMDGYGVQARSIGCTALNPPNSARNSLEPIGVNSLPTTARDARAVVSAAGLEI